MLTELASIIAEHNGKEKYPAHCTDSNPHHPDCRQ